MAVRLSYSKTSRLVCGFHSQAMPDPQKDADRVQKKDWLVVLGACPKLYHLCL